MGSISNKVYASTGAVGVAGALTVILTYFAETIWKIQVPTEVGQALTVLISGIGAFAGGYVAPHNNGN